MVRIQHKPREDRWPHFCSASTSMSVPWNDLGRLWPWNSKWLKGAQLLELCHRKCQTLFGGVSSFQRVLGTAGGTSVFSWFELLAVNNLLILTTYYLPWYHTFMHWRLNMYFDKCLFIMYVLVCKMRWIPVSVCILGPQMSRRASLRALAHRWVNAGLLRLADPNRSLWIQRVDSSWLPWQMSQKKPRRDPR